MGKKNEIIRYIRVGTVMGCGAKIWGWRERKEIERIQEKYLRWMWEKDGRTPGYREEGKREKMRVKMGRRTISYEEKLESGNESDLARRCWEEVKRREERKKSGWEEERKRFYEQRETSTIGVRMIREGEESVKEVMEERDREEQGQERYERTRKSGYNRWYKELRTRSTEILKERNERGKKESQNSG